MAKVIRPKRWLSEAQIAQCGTLARLTADGLLDPSLGEALTLEVVRERKLPIAFERIDQWKADVQLGFPFHHSN